MTRPSHAPSRAARHSAALLGPVLLATLLAGTLPVATSVTAAPAGKTHATTAGGASHGDAGGTHVIPDRLLRTWDPVTIFFGADRGPAAGGAEDHPERVVTLSPGHPGAWTWRDARTLQFVPADGWPALSKFTFTVDGRATTLATLMTPPQGSQPPDGSEGLAPVAVVGLSFPEPVQAEALARAVSIELRPLPGLEGSASRFLGADDFEVKAMERAQRGDLATYGLVLREPIPLGTRALLRLRLTLDDRADQSFVTISFSTAEPFRLLDAGCPEQTIVLGPQGTHLPEEQALRCAASEDTSVVVDFSAAPAAGTDVTWRNLVRCSPAVTNLHYQLADRRLIVSGDFARETAYHLDLRPVPLADADGHALQPFADTSLSVWWPKREALLRLTAADGIVERKGPKMIPLEARGEDRFDVRIFPVDPLDRRFWPFPDSAVEVDESVRPPGPGEQPAPFTSPDRPISRAELSSQIHALGSPPVSDVVTVPSARPGARQSFGLDLSASLARIGGADHAGTYLVGVRRLEDAGARWWMRLQATDLSLTTAEERRAIHFAVTSLSAGSPVAGATVTVEGTRWRAGKATWETVWSGVTDASGLATWTPEEPPSTLTTHVTRLVVRTSDDVLVLDAAHAPDAFHDGGWRPATETWLQWAVRSLKPRDPPRVRLAHVFTDRPVYRPEDTVHVRGWLRTKTQDGHLAPVTGKGTVVVRGPDGAEYRTAEDLSPSGGFHLDFAHENLPTGAYTAAWLGEKDQEWGHASFRVDAYRIPQFEVRLSAPVQGALDGPFRASLSALYYAGGKVSGRPVAWRVTQFPYELQLPSRAGFRWSSDARWSPSGRFESTGTLEKQDVTDTDGAASLELNPAVEPTSQPRSYVIEATVTGPDDQTVTATQRVVALPPFLIGVKAPRYLERATAVEPEILAVTPDGTPSDGRTLTVRLLERQWHSHLAASDFSDGKPRWVTDVVDEKVSETTVTTGKAPLKVPLALPRAGVYVLEVEGHDRLQRAQVVSVDFYAGGEQPVAWQKPEGLVFQVVADRKAYDPGQVAALTLQSPFQSGSALVVVEAPEGNRYSWLTVKNGAATLSLPVEGTWTPRVPVHFILLRGRLPSAPHAAGATADLGRPTTVAATAWIDVNPVDVRANVTIESPEEALPGATIPVSVKLADPMGHPLAGEVALWLVDAAVLSLGKEAPLDPVPDFLRAPQSALDVRDTRNFAFGFIPQVEAAGGEEKALAEGDLLGRTTVRRNFQPVPYWEPALEVPATGKLTVQVKLPDNLTLFKIRAKASSGPERFGAGSGQVAVRLPVLVEPALPRFLRPGDRLDLAGIARVVEGPAGAARAEAKVEGATLQGAGTKDFAWEAGTPARLSFPATVDTPGWTADGLPDRSAVIVRMAVERVSDSARDAFEVKLPLRPDREPVVIREIADVTSVTPVPLPPLNGPARPGTASRTVVVAEDPALVRMVAGLQYLREYPLGCTEQRVSRARALVALRELRDAMGLPATDDPGAAVTDVQKWLLATLDANGLVAFWPGDKGNVALTAWSLQLLAEARKAGITTDSALEGRLVVSLKAALRSDYAHFVDGGSWIERSWALASLAQAGAGEDSYATELARDAQYLDVNGRAQVLLALAAGGRAGTDTARAVEKAIWDGLVFRLHEGRETYGGLQSPWFMPTFATILPSETQAISEATRALLAAGSRDAHLPILVDALTGLGRGNGWGSTNANAEALLALVATLKPGRANLAPATIHVTAGREAADLSLGDAAPVAHWAARVGDDGTVALASGKGPVVARLETRYVPQEDGTQVAPESHGFVVSRESLFIHADGTPPDRTALEAAGTALARKVGDVVEDRVQVVSPDRRVHVAICLPLGAGMEPLDPALATAPPEAKPTGPTTLEPSYTAALDDAVWWFYDELPAGTYSLAFRSRAAVSGTFTQPPASARCMYDDAVRGWGAGARVEIAR